MNRRVKDFLNYIGARFIVAVDPQPSPSWLDNMDRGTVPLTEPTDDLMAVADATHELPRREPQTVAATEQPAPKLASVRVDQIALVVALAQFGRTNCGHQTHADPDAPCDCCAALDFHAAGLADDMEEQR